jgi:hypothetical protein
MYAALEFFGGEPVGDDEALLLPSPRLMTILMIIPKRPKKRSLANKASLANKGLNPMQ